MIELHLDTYYVGMWMAAIPGGDYMCCMWLEPSTGVWVARYRFRRHLDDKAFDSKDTKTWYQMTSKGGDEIQKAHMKSAINTMLCLGVASGMVLDVRFYECEGDGRKFTEILNSPEAETVFVRHMSDEEYKDYAQRNGGEHGFNGNSGRAAQD